MENNKKTIQKPNCGYIQFDDESPDGYRELEFDDCTHNYKIHIPGMMNPNEASIWFLLGEVERLKIKVEEIEKRINNEK